MMHNPEQFHHQVKKLENIYVNNIAVKDFSKHLEGVERSKRNVCFIGPTSVGKTSLSNCLFNLNREVGLGSTTKQATMIKET